MCIYIYTYTYIYIWGASRLNGMRSSTFDVAEGSVIVCRGNIAALACGTCVSFAVHSQHTQETLNACHATGVHALHHTCAYGKSPY